VAQLHHQLNQQREAWDYLQRLTHEHPDASQIDAALYLGMQVAGQLKQEQAAKQWLEKLVADHQQSPYWPDAALRLAEQQVAAAEGPAARALTERLLEAENASTEIAGRARFLLL